MTWAFQNLRNGFLRHTLWLRLAITDIQKTYSRSILGMAWIALSFGLFIGVKILIFGSFANIDGRSFAIWLSIGFWIWTLLSSIVVDGCNSFIAARPWIIGTNLPLSVYVFQTTTRGLIRFMFALPVIIGILFFYKWGPTSLWLWALVGFFVLIINCLWVQLFLAAFCTKYRDFSHLVQSVMRVMFFLTPILYTPEQLGDKAYILNYNPFTHYLAIIRDPIYYQKVPILSWQLVIAFTVIGWVIALITFQKMGREVPFRV